MLSLKFPRYGTGIGAHSLKRAERKYDCHRHDE
jgi:hypothetical protein